MVAFPRLHENSNKPVKKLIEWSILRSIIINQPINQSKKAKQVDISVWGVQSRKHVELRGFLYSCLVVNDREKEKGNFRCTRGFYFRLLQSSLTTTYQLQILRSSRILHIFASYHQCTKHCNLHPEPWHTCRTNHHSGTSTHTALRHRHDQRLGMHCGTSRAWDGEQKALWEGLAQEICLQSNQHILK